MPAERNYSVSERECLAVVLVVQILRPYLEGNPFVLYTDHAALRWMFTISNANTRLARWRIRLLGFDFQVKYRKGAENTVADTISRLPTFGHTETPPDLNIPCLLIDEHMKEPSSSHLVRRFVDSGSWSVENWDPDYNEADERRTLITEPKKGDDFCVEEGVGVHTVEQKSVTAITVDEIGEAQLNDPKCKEARRRIEADETTQYKEDERGLIVKVADIDETIQILLPLNLRQRVLYLLHYTFLAGHPGITKQFYTMRKTFYWPSMPADVRKVSQNCHVCAQERKKLRTHSAALKVFPRNTLWNSWPSIC